MITATGREIPEPPRIRLDTNRKTTIDLKKFERWLLDQGIEEAKSRKDSYNLGWLERETLPLTPSSIELLNEYLFDAPMEGIRECWSLE